MVNFNLETLDFETLQKVSKSIEMIDEQFGGNPIMKRAIMKNYGLSFDDFSTVIESNAIIETSEEQVVQPDRVQEKLTYGDKWYVLQNRLLNAITNLDLNERRLIMFLSPMVRKDVEDFPDKNRRIFTVRALDFAKTYGIDSSNTYGILSDTADKILTKAFWYWNFKDDKLFGEKTYKSGITWVSKCNYLENQGELSIILNDEIVEMLTVFDKANPFTKYQIDVIVKLGCYGIILFELIVSCLYQNFRQKTYTVKYLKEKFNCIDNYKTYYDFKRYVLDRAIKEIHKYTTIRISYEQKKIGRSVSELIFSFEDISQKKFEEAKGEDVGITKDLFVNFKMSKKQLSLFATKIKKMNGQDVDEIISELSNVYLQSKYIDLLKALDFVPSDWYTQEEIEQHPTTQQIAQEKLRAKQEIKKQVDLEKARFKQDYEVLLANAKEFALANQKRIGVGIEKMYFDKGDYQGVVRIWERYLLDKRDRKGFALLDEILSRHC